MKSMGEKFIVQAQAEMIDVELEDGTTQRIHHYGNILKCEDGTLKTVEEALEHRRKTTYKRSTRLQRHIRIIRDESEGDLDRI